MKIPLGLITILMAGTLAAQAPPPATSSASPNSSANTQTRADRARNGKRRSDWMLKRLTDQLNLTQDQQAKVRQIFADTRKSEETLAPKIREEHEALKTAVKENNTAEIDRILQSNSQLNTQVEAMHVKAMAKVYQSLTPDQKTKFDQMDGRWFTSGRHNHAAQKSAGF